MRECCPSLGRALTRFAAALALAVAAGGALAAPDVAADPLLQLLEEKGWVGTPSPVAGPVDAEPSGLLHRGYDRAAGMVVAAMDFVGVRYRRGGTSLETGFDCSGFTRHVFEMSLGLVLPRRADEQANAPGFVAVRREELRPGDLVFFNTLRHTFSHVGIYVGDNRFIHAPRSGRNVRTEDMGFAYWAKRFTGARRAAATTLGAAAKTPVADPALAALAGGG